MIITQTALRLSFLGGVTDFREYYLNYGGLALTTTIGGGFLLVMFPADKRAKVREALREYRELPFRFSNVGSRVVFNV